MTEDARLRTQDYKTAAGLRWIPLMILSCFLFSCSGFNTSGQNVDEKTYQKLFSGHEILNLL